MSAERCAACDGVGCAAALVAAYALAGRFCPLDAGEGAYDKMTLLTTCWDGERHLPRYHFNLYDGERDLDVDGIELASWQDARFEAIRYAGEVLKEDPKRIAQTGDWRMEVTDDVGLILYRLDFCVIESAATSRSSPTGQPDRPLSAAAP